MVARWKKILYTAAIDDLVQHSSLVIATLHPRRHKAIKHERVPLPKKTHLNTAAWGGDGKSVLATLRKEGGAWNIYRFHPSDNQLLQLTDHPASDTFSQEWNPLLPISLQRLVPKRWEEIIVNSKNK